MEENTDTVVQDQKNVPKIQLTWRDAHKQIVFTALAFLLTIQAGINMAYPNLFVEKLNTDQLSWFASTGTLATPVGSLLSGPLSDKFGRRNMHIFIGLPIILSWLLLIIANIEQFYLLIISRLLAGIASGLSTVTLIYVPEIAHTTFRPMLLSLLSVYVSFGILMTTVIGAFFNWKGTATFFAGFSIMITILIAFYLPESPFWIMNFRSHQSSIAKQNLRNLNANDQVFEEEWTLLEQNVRKRRNKSIESKIEWKFTDPGIYRPFLILLCLMFLQQISGAYSVIFYAKKLLPIFENTELKNNNNNEIFVTVGIVRFLASIFTFAFSKYYSRRKLLITSTFFMAILCFMLTTFLNAEIMKNSSEGIFSTTFLDYTNITIFLSFIAVSSVGILNIPWTLIPELLPISIKSIGTSFLISYTYILLFIVTKIFPYMTDNISANDLFLFFGIISVIITIFSYFYIPETLGRNIREISENFQKKINVNK